MPELPEVEVVRRGLDRWVTGRTVSGVDVLHARAVRRHEGNIGVDLIGEEIRCVSRRGKYLWMPLNGTGTALVAHLGMSGQLLMQPQDAPDEAHLRVRLRFADEGPQLRFVDQRTFGGLMVTSLSDDDAGGHVPDIVGHIARDPLDPDFDDQAFEARLRARDTEIKRALLDQSLVSGIGNIYADESLWRAGLHGRRRTGSLDNARVLVLLAHIRAVMTEALAQGGTSFDSLYVNVNGESGYFDRSLDAYGQEGEPCSRCGTIIVRERFMNRSSAFCPRCQPIT
jgi:formamidopyrimidine-DNA glycosylase